MAKSKTGYRTRALVNTAEGAMVGPNQSIPGKFDPKDPHNAALIDAGLIRVMPGAAARPPAPAESDPEPDAESGDDGGVAEPPSMDVDA